MNVKTAAAFQFSVVPLSQETAIDLLPYKRNNKGLDAGVKDQGSTWLCQHKGLGTEKAGCKHWNGKVGQLHIPSSGIALTRHLYRRGLFGDSPPLLSGALSLFYPGVPCKSRASPR